jgi:hypothetical protein
MEQFMICSFFKASQGIPANSFTKFNINFPTCDHNHSLQAIAAVEICKSIFGEGIMLQISHNGVVTQLWKCEMSVIHQLKTLLNYDCTILPYFNELLKPLIIACLSSGYINWRGLYMDTGASNTAHVPTVRLV